MVNVKGIGVFSCIKEDGENDPNPSLIGALEKEDIEKGRGAEAGLICENLIGSVLDKKYGRAKNARNHQFSSKAKAERTEDGESVVDVLEALQNNENLEYHSKSLAKWYIEEIQSRSDLIIVAPFEEYNQNFVAIIKTPFLPDAHEIDTEEVFIENERIIREETDKSILYPFYDEFEDKDDPERVHVYQREGSQHYAKYWWKFIRLEQQKHSDEIVQDSLRNEMEVDGQEEFNSLDDFVDFASNHFDNDIEQEATVSIRIANTAFRIPLNEFRQQDNVRLAKEGNTYYVILSGTKPHITVGSGRQKQDLFKEIEDLPQPSDLF